MSAVAIRTASPTDAAMLARIHALCFEQAWDEAAFSGFLQDARLFALLARATGEWHAFILVRVAADESEILTLATLPVSRRLGLARALVEAGGAEAFRLGARRMVLEVAADNDAALSLYRKAGFTAAGRRPGYYLRPTARATDAVILSAALPL